MQNPQPPKPTAPGWYVLLGATWVLTDELTYRTWANTIHIGRGTLEPR